MKSVTLLLLAAFTFLQSFAQSDKYEAAMQKNMSAIDSSFKSATSMVALANNFERIGKAEKNQWLPYYYSAFLQVNAGFIGQDPAKMDEYANTAERLINTADSLEKNNSEISCIKSMIASARLMVDPMSRYMEFGPLSTSYLDEAIKYDPTNPRPYLLKGQNLRYTPEQFGGGCEIAKPQLNTAMEKFASFKPASALHPNWGESRVKMLLEDCNK
jgi:hypothetical protein